MYWRIAKIYNNSNVITSLLIFLASLVNASDNVYVQTKIDGKRYYDVGINIGCGLCGEIYSCFIRPRNTQRNLPHERFGIPFVKSLGFVSKANDMHVSKSIFCLYTKFFQKINDKVWFIQEGVLGVWGSWYDELGIQVDTINWLSLYGVNLKWQKTNKGFVKSIGSSISFGPNIFINVTNLLSKNMRLKLRSHSYGDIVKNVNCCSIFCDLAVKIALLRFEFRSNRTLELGFIFTNFVSYDDSTGVVKLKNPFDNGIYHLFQLYVDFGSLNQPLQ